MSSQFAGTSASNGSSPRGFSAGSVANRPRRAVEHVEVARLPVQRLARGDPHHLVAVARPVDRAVALRPREPHRVVGTEALGERAVVEPRLAAVGHRRQRQRAGQRDREQRGDAEPGPQRQPLQPQEADRQRREREPEQQRPRAAERHDRRGDDDDQHGERDERVAAVRHRERRRATLGLERRARPERQQPGEDQQLGAEQLEHDPRPRVGADVRQPHGPERLQAAAETRDQLVPVARAQQVELGARERVAGRAARAAATARARTPRTASRRPRARRAAPPPPPPPRPRPTAAPARC